MLITTDFKKASERMLHEERDRSGIALRLLPFGMRFLDRALRGIFPNDLILIGASPGIGKTELATSIARANLEIGKRVYFFALEAEPNEVERRIKYKFLAHLYYSEPGQKMPINYSDWYLGRYNSLLSKYDSDVESYSKNFENLYTLYRSSHEFNLDDLKKHVLSLSGKADLVIVDHIHYLDFDSPNENRALSEITKGIRDLALISGLPHVVIAHLRKTTGQQKEKKLIPSLDDFHGTSNLGKIATKAITIAPGQMLDPQRAVTYFRVAKCRMDGSATRYVGQTVFNISKNEYEDVWDVGRLSDDESTFLRLKDGDLPLWIR